MKKIIFIAFITALMFSNCSNGSISGIIAPLSQAEINDLKFLREEEKLARDVYLHSYDKYHFFIFDNISRSEQKHMDRVLGLLNKYGIADPASTERGVFVNKELQLLYNSLTAKSDISLVDALTVGATIEDLDINDIDHFTANTTQTDLLSVYNNLVCGSKNHIRAFTRQLENNDVRYVPQYISLTEFNLILSSSNGGCRNK
jgi:hypothetical protein